MTDSAEPRVERRDTRRLPAWLWWPITLVLAVGSAVGFYNDAVAANLQWLYWVSVAVLVVFYLAVAAFYLVKLIRWLWRRWSAFSTKARQFDEKARQFAEKSQQLVEKSRQLDEQTEQFDEKSRQFDEKSRQHDELKAELDTWQTAAGEATVRADEAEARVATWNLNSMREGRRRLLGELLASQARTTFRDIEVAVSDEDLIIGARSSGDLPDVAARYLLRSTTLKEPKAVLECVEIRANKTVVFRVLALVSETYRSHLVARASATGSVLTDVEISPREDDLEEEPIWPEN